MVKALCQILPLEEILLIKAKLRKLLIGFNLWSFWKQKIEAEMIIPYLYRGPRREDQDNMRGVGGETLREADDLMFISHRLFF